MNRQVKLFTGLSVGIALGAALYWPSLNGTRISFSQLSYLFELGINHPDFQAQLLPSFMKIIFVSMVGGTIGLAIDKLQHLGPD